MPRSTSRRPPRIAREHLPRIALAVLAGLLLAALSLAVTIGQVFQRSKPDLARAWWPWSAQANAEAALVTAQAAITDRSSVAPAALLLAQEQARGALAREPVNVAAARGVGLVHAANGRDSAARASFAYSERLSRRDLPTQFWLIEERAAAGDVPGTMRHYDRALRTSREAYELLIPVLVQASAQGDVARELARLLAPRPDWWLVMAYGLVADGPSAPAIAQTLQAVRLDPDQPADRELALGGMKRLIDLGDVGRAYRLYRDIAARQGWRVAAVNDGEFAAADDLPPFGWTLADTPQLSATKQALETDPSNQVLQLAAEDGASGDFAHQTLMLPPGAYRFAARGGGIEAGGLARAQVTIACGDRVLARATLPEKAATFGFAFGVPRGCPAQRLAITQPVSGAAPAGAWIDSIAVRAR